MKIAVVGSGISGLSSAYFLSQKHQVDLFEREDHFGGHSHTLDLIIDIFFSGKVDFKINADIHPAFPPPTTITLSFIMKLITTLYRKKINI